MFGSLLWSYFGDTVCKCDLALIWLSWNISIQQPSWWVFITAGFKGLPSNETPRMQAVLEMFFFVGKIDQLMVNWWFGARWFGFLGPIPWWKGLLLRGTPRIPSHRAPNHPSTISWIDKVHKSSEISGAHPPNGSPGNSRPFFRWLLRSWKTSQ